MVTFGAALQADKQNNANQSQQGGKQRLAAESSASFTKESLIHRRFANLVSGVEASATGFILPHPGRQEHCFYRKAQAVSGRGKIL